MSGQLGTSGATLGSGFQLAGTAAAGDPLNQVVAHSFGLIQTLVADYEVTRLATNVLGLTAGEDVESNYVILAISNSLGLAPSSGPDATIEIIQYLGFTDRYPAVVSNVIGLSDGQHVGVETNVSAANYFFTDGDNSAVEQWYSATNSLSLIISAFPFSEQTANNDLALVGTAGSAGTNPEREVTQGFISQHLSYTVSDTKCRETTYSPEVGSVSRRSGGEADSTAFALPPAPTFSNGTLTLTYPYESPSLTLTLKNPEYGDSDTLSFQRIDRETVGGDRKIFSDPGWGNWETLEIRVERIDCEATVDEIIAFLNTSLGREIGLLDWDGQQWRGKILSPNSDIEKQAAGWTVTLRFEGTITAPPVVYDSISVIYNGETVIYDG